MSAQVTRWEERWGAIPPSLCDPLGHMNGHHGFAVEGDGMFCINVLLDLEG
jgi:hypothetical protein